MNNFKINLSGRLNAFLIVFVFILKVSTIFSQGPCDCTALNSTNLCNGGYFADHATAAAASPNPYVPSTPLSWTAGSYTFCTKYTAPANVSKIGFMNFITSGTSSGSSCNFTRGSWTAYASGCSSPVTGTAVSGDANSYEFPVTPGVEYRFCVTVTLTGPCVEITKIENYLYTAATSTPPTGCTSTIGTVAVTGATANGSEWDVSPSATLNLTATGFTLPTSSASPCVATYGYIVFDQAPTLPITDITTLNTMAGYKGISTGATCTDVNNAGKSTSVSTASKLWYVPLTLDCKKGSDNKVHIDDDGDDCYVIGTSAIIVNYLTSTPATPCGTCLTPNCPISNATGTTSAQGSTNLSAITGAATGATDPIAVNGNNSSNTSQTNYYKITVTNSHQILGVKQLLSASPSSTCATRTYQLVSTCGGAVIPPTVLNANNVASGMNPEWNNLPAGNYILSITITSSSPTCEIDYSVAGYYLVDLPVPPCPIDQTFISLDWAQSNPFVPFPSTTYTCASGPQTIWKNVETTISTGGELQAFPGFFMELTTNSSSDTKTSALVTVNGTPYSYYGPTGTAPSGVLDWGPMAVPPQFQNIIEPYLPAGATITITINDLRAGTQSFPYTIYDHSTGATLASGTATPNSTTPIIITFTLSSPTMTWKLDGGTANIIDNHNGSATFNPSNLTSGTHTITYTWTNNAGCNITANQSITVGQTTTAPTTTPVAYCVGATASALSVTPSANCTLNWYGTNQTGGTKSTIAPTPLTTGTGTTTYYVSQTNTTTTCESPRVSIVVTINPNPTLSITDPATVCIPTTVDITAGAVTSGSTTGGTFTYFINPGATNPLPTPTTVSNSGTYYIKSTVGSCSTVLPVTVLINNCACPYNIAITTPAAACSPNTVDITAPAVTAGSVGGGTLTYWSDQACTNSITTVAAAAIATSGTYYIKGDNGVCTDTKPVVVTVNTTPVLVITDPQAVCSPNTVNVTLASITTGSSNIGTLSYWNDATATNSPIATPTAIATSNTYYIKASNGDCIDKKPVIVTVNPLPSTPSVSNASYCQNDVTSPLSTTATAGSVLNWYQNPTGGVSSATTPTITSTTVGTSDYYVTQTDANGCESALPRTQISITIKPIPVVTVNSSTICAGETVTLTANGATTYSWDSATSNSISTSNPFINTPLNSTTFTVTGTTNGCFSSAIATVTVKPIPTLVFVDTLAICSPETVDLTTADRTIGSSPLSTFEYYTNPAGTSHLTGVSTVETGGKYYIQAELNGCKSTMDSVVVIIQQKPAVFFTPSPATVTTTNPIATMLNSTVGAEKYYWNFGDSGTDSIVSPEHSFPNADTATFIITLIAVSHEGCIDSLKKSVKVNEDLIFYVPNSFTPDGDQYNQEFKPIFTSGFDHKGYELLIFDRWGNIVFQTTDYTKGWDGRRLGAKEKVQDGAYTWKIFYSIKSDDRREFVVGHVNVIR